MKNHGTGSALLPILQVGLIVLSLTALWFKPPASGMMLLIPLMASDRGVVARYAVEHGALLVEHGKWPGSLIVRGERARLGGALLAHGIVPVAATSAGCRARDSGIMS